MVHTGIIITGLHNQSTVIKALTCVKSGWKLSGCWWAQRHFIGSRRWGRFPGFLWPTGLEVSDHVTRSPATPGRGCWDTLLSSRPAWCCQETHTHTGGEVIVLSVFMQSRLKMWVRGVVQLACHVITQSLPVLCTVYLLLPSNKVALPRPTDESCCTHITMSAASRE